MAGLATPDIEVDDLDELASVPPSSWQTVVWNDPVNLMSYVSHVFRSYFGFDAATAERLMLAVHHDGHAVVARGPREVMEAHVHAMHDYGLWATVRKDPA
ncbi:ATP-dependent Clp protease adapter ClpS [Microbacterium enclense]|uniref:ATP-dependent Clp protease adapter ClpS n=1 Tax=Microbacterium enclense TaxID=993073 RepID=UPI0036DC8021